MIALGIDSSTQSTTAVFIEIESQRVVAELSIPYADSQACSLFDLDPQTCILSPREEGEADQPPLLFVWALEKLFEESTSLLPQVGCINISAQQHGYVCLKKNKAFEELRTNSTRPLFDIFRDTFASLRAPIWMTSNSEKEAQRMGNNLGEDLRSFCGSTIPARFTGAIIAHRAKRFPHIYAQTARIHLISSFLTALLSAEEAAPVDWGNGAGTALMNYKQRQWSDRLIAACEAENLASRLPPLTKPTEDIAPIAPYFCKRYGFSPECRILAGSGDNPQTKTLAPGGLLSLGTSFVYMDNKSYISDESIDSYDGMGTPFSFVCRTNGALCWDQVRKKARMNPRDFIAAERILEKYGIGLLKPLFWQPQPESFPLSPSYSSEENFEYHPRDYCRIVDSTLALMSSSCLSIFPPTDEPFFLSGGASQSAQIMRRISAFWRKPVISLRASGAALGAAYGAARHLSGKENTEELRKAVSQQSAPICASLQEIGDAQRFSAELKTLATPFFTKP